MEPFTRCEIERIESAFLSGDYCGQGALSRANVKALREDFGGLEDIAFTVEAGPYSSQWVKIIPKAFEPRRDLLITDAQGIYIPQIFAVHLSERFRYSQQRTGIGQDILDADLEICAKGPHQARSEKVDYWESWQNILDSVEGDSQGREEFTLEQDGDVFKVYPVMDKIEALYEALASLLDYPVIDEEALSRQEMEEEDAAAAHLSQYPGELIRALQKAGWKEDKAEALHDMNAEELLQLIFQALHRANDAGKQDVTHHEPQGAYIDCEALAPYFKLEEEEGTDD